MTARNVRMLLVLDADQFVVGLITACDTQGQRPIEWLHDRGGNYADLRVSDLMTVIQDTDTLDLRDVLAAEVGHIIATLKAWGRQHAVVTERNPITGATYIRGIFSATQIGRQLGIAVQPFDIETMFANLDLTLRGE